MSSYGNWRVRLRERSARLTPTVVTNYPFEVIVTFIALLIGLPLILGLVSPTSLVVLLPAFGYWAYAIALMLGGSTLAVGLKSQSPLLLASGLQLCGGSFVIYALAVVAFGGWGVAWAAFAAFLVLGVVSLIRSTHFRRLIDIAKGAEEIVRRSRE